MTRSGRRWLEIAERVVPAEDRSWLLDELERMWTYRADRHGAAAADAALRREVLKFAGLRLRDPARRRLEEVRRGMGELGREVRTAVRSLRRAPGFAVVAILTLAIGIGANALVYGLVDGVLFEDLPYPNSERLVRVWAGELAGAAEYDYIRENSTTLAEAGAYATGIGVNLEGGEEPVRLTGAAVTRSFLDLLGTPLALGGGFTPGADRPGGADEVILSHELWASRFGEDPEVLGRSLQLDGRTHAVVGILPPAHDFPSAQDDLLLPLRLGPEVSGLGTYWGGIAYSIVGRLAPGATVERVTEELRAYTGGPLIDNNPIWTPENNYRATSRVVPLQEALVGDVEGRLWLLLAVVGIVLLVVAANVGNLLLARGMARRRDMAVRAAIGASRWRLVRTQIAEGLVLAAAGTVLGLGLALLALEALRPTLMEMLPRVAGVSIDPGILAVTAAVAVVVGLGAGAIASVRGVGQSPALLMRDADNSARGGRQRLSRLLVTAQVAAAVVLLVSAGLLMRDLAALGAIDPQFDPEGLVTARITLAEGRYQSPEAQWQVLDRVRARLGSDPALEEGTVAGAIPFGSGPELSVAWVDGFTSNPNALPVVARWRVTPEYFSTLGIELVQGRLLEEADMEGGAPVALVDETAVEEIWEGASPIGSTIRQFGPDSPGATVVGVVRAVRTAPITADPRPGWYLPLSQSTTSAAWIVARPRGAAGDGLEAIRAAVDAVDSGTPLSESGAYGTRISDRVAETRFLLVVLSGFAGVTLLLGGLGVYGVTAYSVRRRAREFGVRMALGAGARGIRTEVLRDGLGMALGGSILGLILAIPATRAIGAFLLQVDPLDPVAFALVPFAMAVATLFAVYLPARRATRVDPVEVLRGE